MTYSGTRTIIDADSHLIELDDFLASAATADERALIPTIDSQSNLPVAASAMGRARELFEKRKADPATMQKFEASLRDTSKNGWSRLGAFDPDERSHTLDLLGFRLQLVLPTFAFHQVGHLTDPDAAEVGARVLNRAMAQFCAHDDRLEAIGYVPLRLGPQRAVELIDRGLADGCYSFMLDTNEPDDEARSFTHPDYDPVWARFEAAAVPFVSHVAVNGEYRAISPSFRNNGSSLAGLGGDAGESLLDLVTIKNSVEIFFTAMVFDGVFDRHPGLRGISMEHGAFWLPSWLQALDNTARTARRLLGDRERPSETVRRHLKFSPFAGEPVGWIIDNVGPELLVFGSDYPHPEGTSDPIARFEAAMPDCDPETLDRFYRGNMEELLGITVG
ncbi:MAG: amidohydrolase family protein [Acidimicrobiia bacterium]|nr:amidohydrolase family protein [Acidimicrobiia bacterium]